MDAQRHENLREMHAAGMSAGQIARLFEMSYTSVCGLLWPERERARRQLLEAVWAGDITRPETCEECGSGGDIQAHHDDYAEPLDVVWVCPACHTAKHMDRNLGRPTHEQAKAVWAVSKARQVERAELLETMDLLDIVNLYRRWIGLPPREYLEVVEPAQEAA